MVDRLYGKKWNADGFLLINCRRRGLNKEDCCFYKQMEVNDLAIFRCNYGIDIKKNTYTIERIGVFIFEK